LTSSAPQPHSGPDLPGRPPVAGTGTFGPALGATLITRDIDHSIGIYAEHLALVPGDLLPLDAERCTLLGWPGLEGARHCWLENSLGEPWLEFVENTAADRTRPFSRYGWMSLEIAVQDVDALGKALRDGPFTIIGPPADLAMSDAIRAMQVLGPSGEVLYLTAVKCPVPPFELPAARCPVDRLFIPVMVCPDREAALGHYGRLAGTDGLRFDTPVTVLSASLGLAADHKHAIATVQLAGNTLIEIDEASDLAPGH